MRPLICFYKGEKFLISQDYQRFDCPADQSVVDFLKSFEKEKYFSAMKVVQVNFEFDEATSSQISLYPSAKATVFVLAHHDVRDLPTPSTEPIPLSFHSLTSKDEFVEKTKFIVNQIEAGRIYQANLTSPLKAVSSASAEDLFFHYKNKFSGEYKALLPLTQSDVICFSPELFLQQKNGTLLTRPIKGSLKVGKDFQADLIENQKEEAELSMIVDLLRNDLNSLSNDNSSEVTAHRAAMKLGYIQHTYSEIKVQNSLGLPDVLQKTFPGGSISGCPKMESLHVIREVEKYKRQAYTGSLGWWQGSDFTLNITIRSLIKSGSDIFYHAGCGIVYDSDPEAEWHEYLMKTGALDVE